MLKINNILKINDIYFDTLISLGYNCTVANYLTDNLYREHSLPFDWVLVDLEYIIKCFEEDFKNFFNKKNFIETNYYGKPAGEINNKKERLITYVHDGKYIDLINNEEYYIFQQNKYKRRIDRLYKKLNSKQNILLILYEFNTTIQKLDDFITCLKKKKVNCNLYLLIFTKNKNLKKMSNDTIYIEYNININRKNIELFLLKNINAKNYPKLKKYL
jgi:hypothetical protein